MTLFNPTQYGPNVLLLGGSGSGKTTSAKTLLKALRAKYPDAQLLTTFTEPRWQPLAHISCDDGLHFTYVKPGAATWDSMIERSENLTKLPWEANVNARDKNKKDFLAFVKLINVIADYTCERCGKNFGDVTELPSHYGYWLDSLSGINQMALQMVVGEAVAKSQPQWGAAMGSELQLVNKLCYEMKGWFVLVAHITKLVDEVNGGMIITAHALGKANAPEIPKNFDDVILAERAGSNFKWSNVGINVDTKPTYLPISDNLPPDFATIVRKWSEIQAPQKTSA